MNDGMAAGLGFKDSERAPVSSSICRHPVSRFMVVTKEPPGSGYLHALGREQDSARRLRKTGVTVRGPNVLVPEDARALCRP